jgi:tetratricopeptide (TPR) repeat protein
MSGRDWYRRTTWSLDDEAAFEAKLSRSRGSRSEYLRIQALTLADTRDPATARPAIELASRYLRENPAGLLRAEVHTTVARAFTTLGETDAAIQAYRRAVEAERATPNVRGYASLEFAWFAATRKLAGIYDEVMAAMMSDLQNDALLLPLNQYRYFGALALISSDLGDGDHAKRMARNAVDAAAKETGPFPRHPEVGIVPRQADEIRARIESLAGLTGIATTAARP